MKIKILAFLICLIGLHAYGQNTDPILAPEAAPQRGMRNLGAQKVDSAFVMPVRLHTKPLYTNPQLGYVGRFQTTIVGNDTILHWHNGMNWQRVDNKNLTSKTYVDAGLSTKVNNSIVGQANGVATLDGGGKVPATQLPNSIMTLEGDWNAATNTPALVNGVGNAGMIYECTTPGTVNFGAENIIFNKGDYAVYGNDGTWYKSINSNEVISVAGKTGVVTLNKSDVGLGNIDNTSDANKPISTAQAAVNSSKANIDGSNASSGPWPINITGNAAYSNKLITSTGGSTKFNWVDAGTAPIFLWGANDINDSYVYSPSVLNVGSADNWVRYPVSNFNTPTGYRLLETVTGTPTNGPTGSWGQGIQFSTNNNPDYINQLVYNSAGGLSTRTKFAGTWGSWKRIPTGDGDGATGSWGINITGTAARANTVATTAGDATFHWADGVGAGVPLQWIWGGQNPTDAYVYTPNSITSSANNVIHTTGNESAAGNKEWQGVSRFTNNLDIAGSTFIGFNSNTWTVNYGSGGMNFTKQGTGNALFLKDNTYVGLGTNNPLTKLDVWDNTTGDLITGRVGSIGVSSFILGGFNSDANNAGIYFKTQRAGVMTEAARINHNGNFGIATNNPTSTLHVVGSQRVEGVAKFGTGTVNALQTRIEIANDSGASKQWALSNGVPGVAEYLFGVLNLTSGGAPLVIDGISNYVSINNYDTNAPLTIGGGTSMTAGYNRTSTLVATYPMLTFNSTAGTPKHAGIGYDSGGGMSFWVNATTNDVPGTGTPPMVITNSGVTNFNYNINVPNSSSSTHAINRGELNAGLGGKANADGSNASGHWNISVDEAENAGKLGGVAYNDAAAPDPGAEAVLVKYAGEIRPMSIPDVQAKLNVDAIRTTMTVSIPATNANNYSSASGINIPGAQVGDFVQIVTTTAYNGGIIFHGFVTSANTVSIHRYNGTSSNLTSGNIEMKIKITH